MAQLPPRKTVRTRLLLLSDTHNTFPSLPAADLLIHSGDLTSTGRLSQLTSQYNSIASAPAELKLVIAGNHDITLDRTYYARNGAYMHGNDPYGPGQLEDVDACISLWKGEEARAKGVVYLEEGMSEHRLSNGASVRVYASPYQPEFCGWAFPYQRHEDRFNGTPAQEGGVCVGGNVVPAFPHVDLMVTHGPPYGLLDRVVDGMHVGCRNLLVADRRARPLLHCFGHIHEGWGAARTKWHAEEDKPEEVQVEYTSEWILRENFKYMDLTSTGPKPLEWGRETEFVNASIMNVRYKPVQKPWLIDIDLPMTEEG